MFSFCCCSPLNFRLALLTLRRQHVDGVEMVVVLLLFWLFVIHVQGTAPLRETFETKKKLGRLSHFFLKSRKPVSKPGPVRSPVRYPPPKTRSGEVTGGPSSQKTRSGAVPGVGTPKKTRSGAVTGGPPPVDRDRRPGPYPVASPVQMSEIPIFYVILGRKRF
jgi:hypothetical protein